MCLRVCPVFRISLPEDLGVVLRIFRGCSSDERLYECGASGGVVSSILYGLFSKGEIDGALVTFYDSKLNLFGDFITSEGEIISHSGSFYHTCRQLTNFRNIDRFRSVAIVGLPCHIAAAHMLAEELGCRDRIRLFISLFCSIGRMKRGLEDFLTARKGVNLSEVSVSVYRSRYGIQRPGLICISTERGSISFEYQEYLGFVDYFYMPEGCYHCRQLYGLQADISVGDDWGVTTLEKIALVCVNTTRGLEILRNCTLLKLWDLGEDGKVITLIASQPMGYPRKFERGKGIDTVLRLVKFLGRFNTSRFKVLRKVALGMRFMASKYVVWLHKRRLVLLGKKPEGAICQR